MSAICLFLQKFVYFYLRSDLRRREGAVREVPLRRRHVEGELLAVLRGLVVAVAVWGVVTVAEGALKIR